MNGDEQEMPATMSATSVDWATLSVPEFVAWARLSGLRLPFPLDSGELSFQPGPTREELEEILTERKLAGSPVLATAAAVFDQPRLGVYAVRVTLDGTESRYAAFAGRDDQAIVVLIEPPQVALRAITDVELAASVVGALPQLPVLHTPAAEVSLRELVDIDAAIEAGASPRTLSAQMGQAGLPASLVALRQRVGNAPTTAGALGAVGFADDTLTHSRRSATWREFDGGALLQIERGRRQGQARILLTPYTNDALFRAAVDAIGSVYEARGDSADRADTPEPAGSQVGHAIDGTNDQLSGR
jgi:hypothetical protein